MKISNFYGLIGLLTALGPASAFAQDDVPPGLQCLRYLQSAERSLHVPQGLLTAISLVETGRPTDKGDRVVPWPWTINVNGQGKFFDTKEEAVTEVRAMLDQGQRSINVGCLQVNLRYHPDAFRSLEDAFDPSTNVAYGAQYLNTLHQTQGSWSAAVERYHSSESGRREEYRDKVLALWNNQARDIVMDEVLAENTDTPYHHAMRDFAAADYNAALLKYQAILKSNPNDRLGLLGVAMSYDKLGQDRDADAAYGRYLTADPDDESALAHVIAKDRGLPAMQARANLETLAKAGVIKGELFAALADIAAKGGDDQAAFKYAAQAVTQTPNVAAYNLNAGILADRLKQPATAVKYYDDFLALSERTTISLDASIDSVRARVIFLRAKL